jgi:hypothetical protein
VTAIRALAMPVIGIMDMSVFPPTVVRQKVPAVCCEHLAGTALANRRDP